MPKRIMRAFKMNEISAVDNPAQAHARMLIMKRAPVAKDMYGVSRFAEVLQSICYLMQSSEDEAEYEGDKSPIPAALRTWLRTGASIFSSMAREEIDELVTTLMTKRFGEIGPEAEAYLKREFSAEQRQSAATSGSAEADGSFPIENASDLKNAMRAVGRSKNPAKTKAHIRARAKALGLTSMLSDTFKRDTAAAEAALAKSVKSIFEDHNVTDRQALVLESIHQFTDVIKGDAREGEDDMTAEEINEAIAEAVAKATTDVTKSNAALVRENAILKMAPAHKAYFDTAGLDAAASDAFIAADEAGRAAIVAKHAASQKLPADVQKRLDDAEEDRKVLKALQEKDAVTTFEKRAIDLGLEASCGVVLRKAYGGDAEAQGKLDALIKGLAEQVRTGVVFKEFGTSRGGGTTPREQLDAKAADLRKAESGLTKEQAFAKVYEDPANRDIVKAYKQEQRSQQRAA